MKSLQAFIDEVTHSQEEVDIQQLIACLDLTSLDELDSSSVIRNLCKEAQNFNVAAVCVFPEFVAVAKEALTSSTIKIATVANFPKGHDSLADTLTSIQQSLEDGADEIDVVIPYEIFLIHHNETALRDYVAACKKAVGKKYLKTILECGVFSNLKLLERASLVCLEAGSDFLKTSTGKTTQGASLEAAAVMLNAIVTYGDLTRGFKASGGVRKYQQAKQYYLLAQKLLGKSWPTPNTFRIGASSLLKDLNERI